MKTPSRARRTHTPLAAPGGAPPRELAQIQALLANLARDVHRSCPTVGVDDLIQVGELRLHELRQRFDPSRGASLCTFVYKSVRSAMRRFARRVTSMPLADLPEPLAPSPEDLALDTEERHLSLRTLERGLARLDPVDAQLLLRVEGAGEPISTVARTLGIDYDAARYRIRTGRVRLVREIQRAA